MRLARELGTTYVMMGTPALRSGLGRLRNPEGALLMRLLRELPGVDVRVVADPTLRERQPAEESAGLQTGPAQERVEPT